MIKTHANKTLIVAVLTFFLEPNYLNPIVGEFDDRDERLFNGLNTSILSVTCAMEKNVFWLPML